MKQAKQNLPNAGFTLICCLVVFLNCLEELFAQLPPVFGKEYTEISQRDELTRVFISPIRVLWTSDTTVGKIKQTEVLLLKGNSQSTMDRQTKFCTLKSTIKDTASIILDYGRELHGGLQLVMGGSSRREPSLVRIRFGESVGEVNSQTYNSDWLMGFSTDDHAKRDIIVEIPRSGIIEIGNTGFRFVRIDLLQPETSITLKEARAVFRYRDIPYLGTFRSSDSRLDSIWLTGAYTTHLNMQEYLWDGIKRDRLVWLGDFHPELLTITKVFGYNEVIPKSLDLACEQYPLPNWMNGMTSYSFWYLIIHYDWFMQNGDLNFLNQHREYIKGLIAQINAGVDQNGDENLGRFRFLDWPSTPNKEGVEAGFRALLVWAMQDAKKLMQILDEKETEKLCDEAIEKMARKVMPHNELKQAAGLMVIAGSLEAEIACQEVIGVGGAAKFSTFYGLYMLEALSKAGKHKEAIQIARDYWGGMLDMGATSFWEDFDVEWKENSTRIDEFPQEGKNDIHGSFGAYCYPSYRHSLCHGWASGVTAWMTEHILGIQIMQPGCKVLSIEPNLGDLDWAEGKFPTPHGIVSVKHTRKSDGSIHTEVDAPEGISIQMLKE